MASIQSVLGAGFDSSAVAPSESRDGAPLPAGLYTVEITDSDVKALKSGNGMGLSLEFTVIDPAPFAKRKVWQNINIKHNSAEAERIGQAELSALCRAVGIGVLQDSDELFQKILRIRTKIRKQTGYADRAEVSGFEPAGAPLPASTGGAPAAGAAGRPAAATGASPRPWERKATA